MKKIHYFYMLIILFFIPLVARTFGIISFEPRIDFKFPWYTYMISGLFVVQIISISFMILTLILRKRLPAKNIASDKNRVERKSKINASRFYKFKHFLLILLVVNIAIIIFLSGLSFFSKEANKINYTPCMDDCSARVARCLPTSAAWGQFIQECQLQPERDPNFCEKECLMALYDYQVTETGIIFSVILLNLTAFSVYGVFIKYLYKWQYGVTLTFIGFILFLLFAGIYDGIRN